MNPDINNTPDLTSPAQSPSERLPGESKRIFALIILLGLICIGIALYIPFLLTAGSILMSNPIKTSQPQQPQQESPSKQPDKSPVSRDSQTITVKPGDNILLADKKSKILFSNSGSEEAVPDVVFGTNYALNDIHHINYLPIRHEVSFYNNGYFISLKNQGCNTETRFTDVEEIWVTDCSIQIQNQQVAAPVKKLRPFFRRFTTSNGFSDALTTSADQPFLYISYGKLSLQNYKTKYLSGTVSMESGGMTSYSTNASWLIRFVTSYGIDTIEYEPEEVWNKDSEQISIGPLTITATIKDYSCRVIFTSPTDRADSTSRCENIPFEVTIVEDTNNQMPMMLNSFSE